MSDVEKDVIELDENDAAIVLKEDGELQIYVPDKDMVGDNVQFITAIGCMMNDSNFRDYVWAWWRDQVDTIKAEDGDELDLDFEPEEF